MPWKELEGEAARQGCSAADIFFDRAGRITGLPTHAGATPLATADLTDGKHESGRR